jgi:hypothetical protein
MLAQVLPYFLFRAGAVAQEEHGLLVCPFSRIFILQFDDFLIAEFVAVFQPRGCDSRKPKGKFSIEVDIHPVWVVPLERDGGYLFHY